jgi:hypothetical protein
MFLFEMQVVSRTRADALRFQLLFYDVVKKSVLQGEMDCVSNYNILKSDFGPMH